MQPAKTAAEARWTCEVFPLHDPGDSRYVDLTSYIGLVKKGKNRFITDLDPRGRDRPHYHVALAGPRGSGKSTLVHQSLRELEERGLYPVYVDVLEALDPGNIAYSDLLLTLVGKIDEKLAEDGIVVGAAAREDVRAWFAEHVLTEEHRKELDLSAETRAEIGVRVPIVGGLVSKITAAFKGGSRFREEIRQRIDQSPNDLVEKVNLYLDAATEALRQGRPGVREILFFYDNLEKVVDPERQIDEALIRRAPLHRQIRCSAVYTIPFHLLREPRSGGLVGDAFKVFLVPMVALRDRDAAPDVIEPPILQALTEILARRVDLDAVFETRDIVTEIVRASGGCPRDLLHLTVLACEYAGDGKVTETVVRDAIRRGAVEHVRPARPDDFGRLARIHRDKQIDLSPDDFRLLNLRLAVHYDDTEWYDAHPLVFQDRRFEAALARATASPQK